MHTQQRTSSVKQISSKLISKNALGSAIGKALESLEGRRMLAANLTWVNDNWTLVLDNDSDGKADQFDIVNDPTATGQAALGVAYGVQGFGNVVGGVDNADPTFGDSTVYIPIQKAIDGTNVGKTLTILPGTYTEQFSTNKDILVQGTDRASTRVVAPSTLNPSIGFTYGSFRQPIFAIQGASVTIKNITFDGAGNGGAVVPGNDFVGIGSKNSNVSIDNVEVTGVRDSTYNGVQRGRAILLTNDSGTAKTISVTNSLVNDYQKNGIDVRGLANVTLTGNTITGQGATGVNGQNGIVLLDNGATSNATISNNTISGNTYAPANFDGSVGQSGSGILLGSSGATVTKNTLSNNDIGVIAYNFTVGVSAPVSIGDTNAANGNNFDTATDNKLDISIAAATNVSLGNGNQLGGDNLFIRNESATDYNLVGTSTTFDTADNYRVEDGIYHKLDNAGSGLIRVVATNLYVTTPSVGSTDSNIQRAINAAATSGDTINIEGGSYTESVTVDRSVSIVGAGSGSTTLNNAAAQEQQTAAITIAASNVSISGLKVQVNLNYGISVLTGSRSNLSFDDLVVAGTDNGGRTFGEFEIGFYISPTTTVTGLTITDSVFTHLLYGYIDNKELNTSDASIVTNVLIEDTSFISNASKGFYSEKLDHATFNDVSFVNNGFFGSWYQANNVAAADINLKKGVYSNITFNNPTFTGNAIFTVGTDSNGVADNGAALTIKARDDGSYAGANAATLSNVQVNGGTFTNNRVGIRIGEFNKANLGPTNVIIDGASITGTADAGIILTGGVTTLSNIDFTGGVDNVVDVRIAAGAQAGTTLGDGLKFAGDTYFIENLNVADQDLTDNTGITFDETSNFAIEAKIYHKVDNAAYGLVRFAPGNVIYVGSTALTGDTPTAIDNDYTRIKNAVMAAGDGYTIQLEGTFDWSETNAAASWAKGNDGNAGTTADNNKILVPDGLDNITFTSSSAGATISNPLGDLAGVDFEAVLYFAGSVNVGWTISNLHFSGFDLSIGFFNGSNSHEYDNTSILNNVFDVPADKIADASQNIGVHYSFGANITIQGNTFNLDGSGLSSGTNFSATAAIQSNTNGNTYQNLLIDSNTINVTGTLAAEPSVILGIWENGHAHNSNVTISNNHFYNLTGANAATNLMRAYRLTSHSGASSTVTYSGNTADGANIGFQWLAGQNFAGNQPIVVSGNTLTNVQTGFLVQSNGRAIFSNNSVSGIGGSSIGYSIAAGSVITVNSGSIQLTDTAILLAGTGSIDGVNFNAGTDNNVDIRITSTSTGSTIGSGNTFGGQTFFIRNESNQSFNLGGFNASTFEGLTSKYAVEDLLYHALDNSASGLIRFDGSNLYVTIDGTGASDESINRAVAAAADGDTINLQSGTHKLFNPVVIDKPIRIVGEAAGAVTVTAGASPAAFPAALFNIGGGSLDSAADNVSFQNVILDGTAGGFSAVYGIYVGSTANFGTLRVEDGAMNNLTIGLYAEGNATTGLSVRNIELDTLSFAGNGGTGGGTGDVSLFAYNGNASFSHLDHVGTGSAQPASAIQLRGVGTQTTGIQNMGTVSFNDVDISGTYNRAFISLQRYNSVAGLSFNDVALAGATSQLTGIQPPSGATFGALIRFDSIGAGSLGSAQTLSLGNTAFRGFSPSSNLKTAIEFSTDSFGFLYVDATNTSWNGVNAASLSLNQAFDAERQILDYTDALPPGFAFQGFVRLQSGKLFAAQAGGLNQPVSSIQRNINVADTDDVVNIEGGTFTESITLNRDVDLVGAGMGATTLAGIAGAPVVTLSASGSSGDAIQIKDLKVQAALNSYGLSLPTGSVSYLTLDHVDVAGNNSLNSTEGEVGLHVGPTASLTNLSISDSAFRDLAYGWYFFKQVGGGDTSTVSDVTVTNTTFDHNVAKGVYAEKLNNATFTNAAITNNGYWGGFFNANFAAGVDINLKSGTYANIVFNNPTVSGNAIFTANPELDANGVSDNGAGITIKGRDDAPSYSGSPATVTGVVINGGTFTGNRAGIRMGEVGKANATPIATISGATITGSQDAGIILAGGSSTISDINFDGATDNAVDIRIAAGAQSGTTLGNNLAFAGDTFFIENRNTKSFDLTTLSGISFDETNNFRIEDKVFHKVDDLTSGLVTWVAGNLFVTAPGSGSTDSSIQRAVDAASTGNTIHVEAGTYAEAVTVNKSLTIEGAGSTASVVNATGSAIGITLAASNVTLRDLGVTGATSTGFQDSGAVSNITLQNVASTGNVNYGFHAINLANLTLDNVNFSSNGVAGLRMGTAAVINGLTITGGSFSNNQYGIVVFATSGSTSNQNGLTNVNITGTTFNANTFKGLYFEKLNNAVLDAITVTNNGTSATPQAAGIDLNLKYGSYQNITIKNSTFTGNGTGDAVNGGAILLKARSDAPSYAANPATLDGLTVRNNFVHNNQGGIVLGEPGKNLPTPLNTLVTENSITGNTNFGLRNETTGAVNAEANWWGQIGGPTIASNGAPGAKGDAITGTHATTVDYSPFLTDGTDTNLVAPGFQPNGPDITPPDAPSAPDLTTDTGRSSTDNITGDNTPSFDVVYTGEVPATLQLVDALGNVLVSQVVTGSGTFTLTLPSTQDGTYVIHARAIDQAGNASADSGSISVTIDTAAPAAPTTPDLDAASDSQGVLTGTNSDDITNDTTPTFSGTAEADATVTLYEGSTVLGTVIADGSGNWSITSIALGEGSHTIYATATDAAGNVVGQSGDLAVTIDTTIATPSAADLTTDTGDSSTDDLTNDNTPTFTGTAEAFSTISVYDGLTLLGQTTTDSSGNWTFTSAALADGSHTITVVAIDRAGNQSSASTALVINVDTATATPSTPDLDAGSDTAGPLTGTSSDNLTNDTTPTFSGTAEVGATVRLYDGLTLIGTGIADGSGNWSITSSALGEGAHTITAIATDIAGNESAVSGSITVTIDTIAPAQPAAPDLDAASDSGNPTDNNTDDTTPTFTGTAEPGSTIRLFVNGNLDTSVVVGLGGTYSITASGLTDGTYVFTVDNVDAAGNVSTVSDGLSVTIDASDPVAPSALDLDAASDTGRSSTDDITKDTTPTISGLAEAGSLVTIYANGNPIGTTTANGSGEFTFTAPGFADGVYVITADATDTAGNTSAVSGGLSITIDTTAPTGNILGNTTADEGDVLNYTNDVTDLNGPIDFDWSVSGSPVTVNSGTNTATSYSITPNDNGSFTLTLTTTDTAGNVSTRSLTLAVSNVAPTVSISETSTIRKEGTAVTFTAGSFFDPSSTDTFTFTWNVTGPGGYTYSLPGTGVPTTMTFTPPDKGNYSVTLTVSDDDSGTFTTTPTIVPIADVAPTVAVSVNTPAINEGQTASVTLSNLFDPGTNDVSSIVSISVTWGDGSFTTLSAGDLATLKASPSNSITLPHLYADDGLSSAPSDAYPVRVNLTTTTDGSYNNIGNAATVTVSNVAPTGITSLPIPNVPAGSSVPVEIVAQSDVSAADQGSLHYAYGVDLNNNGTLEPGEYVIGNGTYGGSSTSSSVSIPGSYFATPGTYRIFGQVIDKDGGSTISSANVVIDPVSFRVTSIVPTASGFIATFNHTIDRSVINLFSGANNASPADVVLTGPGGVVRGSLIFNSALNAFQFVATGGILAAGSYTLSIVSGDTAFQDSTGDDLDGDTDGNAGGNFSSSFNVAGPTGPVLSLPDFARGPGQSVDIDASSAANDLPVTINSPVAISSINFKVNFDPNLISIPLTGGVTLGSAVPVGWSIAYSISGGVLTVSLTKPGPAANIPAGLGQLVKINASVINNAANYGKAQVLSFSDIVVNGSGSIVATGDSAVHKVVFLGDADYDGAVTSGDASLMQAIVLGYANGFANYPVVDPVIVADSSSNGLVDSQDATNAALTDVGLRPAVVPDYTPISVPSSPGADPTLGIPSNILGHVLGTVHVPVNIVDDARGVMSGKITLSYDTSKLTLTNGGVLTGTLANGWTVVANVNDATGTAVISFFGGTPIAGSSAVTGELLGLDFTVDAGASEGVTPITMAASTNTGASPTILRDSNSSLLTTVAGSGSIVIDNTTPTLQSVVFNYAGSGQSVVFTFSEDVSASIAAGDFELKNLSTNTLVDVVTSVSPDGKTVTLTFANTGGINASILKDGNYRIRMFGGAVQDPAGNAITGDQDTEFFFLNGDANHDRAVNFDDLLILAQHYGTTTGGLFADGDINYDGEIGFNDLLLLSQKYDSSLPALTAFSSTAISSQLVAAPAKSTATKRKSNASVVK